MMKIPLNTLSPSINSIYSSKTKTPFYVLVYIHTILLIDRQDKIMRIENVNEDQLENLLKSNDKVVVKFYADWCGVCKAFSPEFERMSSEDQFSDLKIVEINAPENPKARLLAGVYSLPFFATFYKNELLGKCPSADRKMVKELLENIAQPNLTHIS